MRIWLTWLLLILGWIAVLVYARRASADEGDGTLSAFNLSRLAVGEAGLSCSVDELTALYAVIQSRAERMGVTEYEAARLYTRAHHWDRTRDDRRAWIAWLHPEAKEPHVWPDHLDWGNHRARWLRILTWAEAAIEGRIRARCRPAHWGSKSDWVRFRKANPSSRRARCGDVVNVYVSR